MILMDSGDDIDEDVSAMPYIAPLKSKARETTNTGSASLPQTQIVASAPPDC
jgi:hypothetical protein